MDTKRAACPPWWKFGHVWLVLAGPAAAVVAGVVTTVIAVRQPDPVLVEPYRRGAETDKALAHGKALVPAQQGRNHAATPAR